MSWFSGSMLHFTKQKGPLSNIKLLSLCSGLVVRAYWTLLETVQAENHGIPAVNSQ